MNFTGNFTASSEDSFRGGSEMTRRVLPATTDLPLPLPQPGDSRTRPAASPRVRRTLGARFRCLPRLAIIVACAVLFVACGQKEVTKVSSEKEAIEILDVLNENGIKADKEEVGDGERARLSIVVAEDWFGGDDVANARRVLRDHGLPRSADKGLEGAYEGQGLMPSLSAQAAQRLKQQETEVERQLRALRNVAEVEVNIAPPDNDPLNLKPQAATASVVIVHTDEKFVATPEEVQGIVANGVPSLPVENVRVSLMPREPRPISRAAADTRRRYNLFIAGGVGLMVVLCASLLVFFLQNRRQKAQLAARQAEAGKTEAEAELAPASGDGRWLGGDAAARTAAKPEEGTEAARS